MGENRNGLTHNQKKMSQKIRQIKKVMDLH